MMPLTNDGELMVVWEKCLLYCSLALGFFFLLPSLELIPIIQGSLSSKVLDYI